MPINMNVIPAQVPEGTCPATWQQTLNVIAQYLQVQVPEQLGFGLFSFGSSTPSVDRQDFPWFQTNTDGTPYDINVYADGAWVGFGFSHPPSQSVFNARLTLTTNTPVTTSDVTGSTLYLTRFNGNVVTLYNGVKWSQMDFDTDVVYAAGSLLADTNYDVFLGLNGTTLELTTAAWTGATTRTTALATQDGVYVQTGDPTKRYVGTIRVTSTLGLLADTLAQRFVWNYLAPQRRPLFKIRGTSSYGYTVATYRQCNADATFKTEVVIGIKDAVNVQFTQGASANAGAVVGIGIGVDSIVTPTYKGGGIPTAQATYFCGGIPYVEGYHYFSAMEDGAAGCTFYGDNLNTNSYEIQRLEGWLNA